MNTKGIVGVLLLVIVIGVSGYVYVSSRQVAPGEIPNTATEPAVYVDPITATRPAGDVPAQADNSGSATNPAPMPVDNSQSSAVDRGIESDISSILADMNIDNSADFAMDLGL
jgi:hypothetical protein